MNIYDGLIDGPLCYLATPYSKTPDIERAFLRAAQVAEDLSRAGVIIFSPIAHGHSIAKAVGADPNDPAIFVRLNQVMLDRCDVLIVVQMEGWHTSDGMREEFAFFERKHKPIFYLDPQTMVIMRHRSQWTPEESTPDRTVIGMDGLPIIYNQREPVITSGESPQADAGLVKETESTPIA